MDPDRIKHSYRVAIKMIEIGKKYNMTDEELEELFLLGYLHDVGYQFGDNMSHNKIGGKILKNSNYKYWREVYYHGVPNSEYKSTYLDILNMADTSIDKYGNDVGQEKRLEDIKNRYGEDSIQYNNYVILINELKK